MSQAQAIAAFGQIAEHFIISDPGDGNSIDIGPAGCGLCAIDSTGDVTIGLPDDGFLVFVHNSTGAGTITLNDYKTPTPDRVAEISDKESALCIRVGLGKDSPGDDQKWHAVILTFDAGA